MDCHAFPWSSLISPQDPTGGHSFEEIAFDYVEDNYSQYRWKKTPMTCDGNRDAYAIISVFSSTQREMEIWMEAKFSTKSKRLSRFVIDKTIVSALCNGRVQEVFFVTNLLVLPRVKEQVLCALGYDGFRYQDVHFCTKYDLEIWLTASEKGQATFKRFFNGQNIDSIAIKEIAVLGEPSFYEASSNPHLYLEPLSVLNPGQEYIANITVFSKGKKPICAKAAKKSSILVVDTRDSIPNKWIHELTVRFVIPSESDSMTIVLSDGSRETEISFSIPINKGRRNKLIISSQEQVKKKVLALCERHEQGTASTTVVEIVSSADMGKSFLLGKLIESIYMRNRNVLFYAFSPERKTNYYILAELALRLFYFSTLICDGDSDYSAFDIPECLKELLLLIKNGDDDVVEGWMTNLSGRAFIPEGYRNGRVIILDNTDLLSEGQSLFLTTLLDGIKLSESHSFIILSGRRSRFTLHPFRIGLSLDDVRKSLIDNQIRTSASILSIASMIVFDVSSLSLLIESLQQGGAHALENNLATARYADIIGNMMIIKFDRLISAYGEESKDLLLLIYTLTDGLRYETIDEDDDALLRPLLEENIVINGTESYIPRNSLLKRFFRAHYTQYNLKGRLIAKCLGHLKEEEQLRLQLGSHECNRYLKKALDCTERLIKGQDYLMVHYLLEPLFSPTIRGEYSTANSTCVQLHFYYLYAKANVDTHFEIRKEFERFADNIVNTEDPASCLCRVRALSEVVCFAFEDADLPEVSRVSTIVKNLCLSPIIREEETAKDALFLCEETNLLSLCSADLYSEAEDCLKMMESEHGDSPGMHIAKTRYAHYLFHRDIDKALAILRTMGRKIEADDNPKWNNACLLEIGFGEYLKTGNPNVLDNHIFTLKSALPRFVSLFRSYYRLLSACALVNSTKASKLERYDFDEFYNYWDEYNNESGSRFGKDIGFDNMIKAAIHYLKDDHEGMTDLLKASETYLECLGMSYRIVIEHNESIPKDLVSIQKRILFYNENVPMEPAIFYLDPRM